MSRMSQQREREREKEKETSAHFVRCRLQRPTVKDGRDGSLLLGASGAVERRSRSSVWASSEMGS